MKTSTRTRSMVALLAVWVTVAVIAVIAHAQGVQPTGGAHKIGSDTGTQPMPATMPANSQADADRKAQIQAIDEKIKTLRTDFKSQTDPLEAQLKQLRDQFDTNLKELQQQRDELVMQGESPALRDLNSDETAQLQALSDKEKADIDKLRQSYDQQRQQLRQSFAERRKELSQHH